MFANVYKSIHTQSPLKKYLMIFLNETDSMKWNNLYLENNK